ncbi:hypothetical protein C8R46DRAFT_1065188 [Mycena filopes]|nr:hypothetical protein C8R46DRAFT_1065188 [Mycena filopes]
MRLPLAESRRTMAITLKKMTRRPRRAPTPAELPLELQFLILDQILDDILELRRMGSVCKAWADHVQKGVLRRVWVTSMTAPRLLQLFQDTSRLGRYVEFVTMVEPAWHTQNPHPAMEQFLTDIVDNLPNLRTLDILGHQLALDMASLQTCTLERITHLRLRMVNFARADGLLQLTILALFPHLEGLDISGVSSRNSPPVLTSSPPPSPPWSRLRYLACDAFCCAALMKWLGSGPVVVDNLFITAWGYNIEPLEDFFRKVGDGVRRLRLTAQRSWQATGSIALPAFTSLQSLEVELGAGHLHETSPRNLEAGFLSILTQLSSPALTTMYFEVYVSTTHLDLPWDRVDAALAAFGALQEVVFDLYGFVNVTGGTGAHTVPEVPEFGALCEGMRRAMRRSDARGILRFCCAGRRAASDPGLLRYMFT